MRSGFHKIHLNILHFVLSNVRQCTWTTPLVRIQRVRLTTKERCGRGEESRSSSCGRRPIPTETNSCKKVLQVAEGYFYKQHRILATEILARQRRQGPKIAISQTGDDIYQQRGAVCSAKTVLNQSRCQYGPWAGQYTARIEQKPKFVGAPHGVREGITLKGGGDWFRLSCLILQIASLYYFLYK